MRTSEASDDIVIREPTVRDGVRLHALVRQLPPLAENSVYCNLLQCTHFADTCAVAERVGELVGFVTGYRHPKRPRTYYLWQVGVHEHGRGRGLALRMIRHILARPACRGIDILEATAAADNPASRALFESLARAEGAQYERVPAYLEAACFGPDNATPEDLLRVHPLSTPPA